MKKFLKIAFTTFGLGILIACITGEVDGVGRFAMVLFGTIFVYVGLFIKEK